MRLRVTLDALVILDVTLFEPEQADEPGAVHDLTGDNQIGFSAPIGWSDGGNGTDG